jgi:NADH-quinone oxidoreductase subunit G
LAAATAEVLKRYSHATSVFENSIMADPVKFTIDGKRVEAAPGTLVIDAAKRAGIEIPAFCYYEGYSLQAACRMCLVEVEKMPKLQVACTLPVAEGMVVAPTPQVASAQIHARIPAHQPSARLPGLRQGRRVRTAGHGVPLRRGRKPLHREQGPRGRKAMVARGVLRCPALHSLLPLRARLRRRHGRGRAGRDQSRRGFRDRAQQGRSPGMRRMRHVHRHLPGGRAHQRRIYRYQTRPWEMEHVGTICTHCSNGCKTTLGVRNDEIIRGNNRDRSGINGEFLCIKGRYAFDFYDHPERLQSPLVRVNGKLEPVSWSKALETVAKKFNEDQARAAASSA